jgi:hypothetical protein
MTVLMIWNLHDWSGNREPQSNAQPRLLKVLNKCNVQVAFLNEVRNLGDLVAIVGHQYNVYPTARLVYATDTMLANPQWTLRQAMNQGARPFSEYYALLVERDSGITCDSLGLVTLNPQNHGTRKSPRFTKQDDFSIDQSTDTESLVCRVYRPAWAWACYKGNNTIQIVGVHTKPIGSKVRDGYFSTLAQTRDSVVYAADAFPSRQWVACGDFYADPGELKVLLEQDSIPCRIHAPTECTNYPHHGQGCIADYFVVGGDLHAWEGAERIDISQLESTATRYSDHDPVLIHLNWP